MTTSITPQLTRAADTVRNPVLRQHQHQHQHRRQRRLRRRHQALLLQLPPHQRRHLWLHLQLRRPLHRPQHREFVPHRDPGRHQRLGRRRRARQAVKSGTKSPHSKALRTKIRALFRLYSWLLRGEAPTKLVSISVHSWLARLSPRKNPEKHEKR